MENGKKAVNRVSYIIFNLRLRHVLRQVCRPSIYAALCLTTRFLRKMVATMAKLLQFCIQF